MSHKRHRNHIGHNIPKNAVMDKNKESHIKDIEKNLDKVIIFKDDTDFLFIYKKSEKIATAIYLITNFFSVHDPLKWALREAAINLLKDISTLSNVAAAESQKVIKEINGTIFRTLSLFEIGYKSGFVSEMNFSILKDEFYAIVTLLESRSTSHDKVEGIALDTSFFHVDKPETVAPIVPRIAPQKPQEKHVLYKGHAKGHDVLNQIEALHNAYSSNQNKPSLLHAREAKPEIAPVDKSDERQKMIINYLKINNVITIKDLTRVIQGCSEKTIQRDLGSLIQQGIVKKVGERRWSKYYLV